MIWMNWPQSRQPFTTEELELINAIDPFEDAQMIQEKVNIRKLCLLNFIISNILLKKGAQNGLTLFEIGTIIY